MGQVISGPGIGLQLPQNLYPTALQNAPYDASTNRIGLAPGDTLPIPAGTWYVNLGMYSVLQFLDPVTGIWSMGPNAGWTGGIQYVKSDGFNVRVANLLGCPVSASVQGTGSNYVQATTTVTPTPNNGSTWVPIIGGALALANATISTLTAGAGYGVAPLGFIPAPPPAANNPNGVGGIAASGYAQIASGTVSGFSLTNAGGGYQSSQTIVFLPSPTDPNINVGITLATAVFTVTGSGQLRGALCTNNGSPLADPNGFTLTVSGAGSSGSLVGNVLQTVTAASVSGAGSGYGTLSALLTTVGGAPSAGSITASPDFLGLAWRPRPAQVALAVSGAGGTIATQTGTIYDGGLFLTNAKPNFVLSLNPITASTQAYVGATIALTMGNSPDIVTLQPAP